MEYEHNLHGVILQTKQKNCQFELISFFLSKSNLTYIYQVIYFSSKQVKNNFVKNCV